VLNRHLDAHPKDRLIGAKLPQVQRLWQRADEMRRHDPAERLAELLADGGLGDELRHEADAGNASAAERLVDLLADRGCLSELRDRADRGERRAAEALADLYAGWGEADLLRTRAEAGDTAAELRLSKMHQILTRHEGARYQIGELRAAVDEGRPEAAIQLCTLLFELRDEPNLRAELEAGTTGARDRLIALYTAQEHPALVRLRAFGLDADGNPRTYVPGKDF
jgi:hypothetical protein